MRVGELHRIAYFLNIASMRRVTRKPPAMLMVANSVATIATPTDGVSSPRAAEQAADDDDAADRVGHAHQRRVQRGRHVPHDLEADEHRHHEHREVLEQRDASSSDAVDRRPCRSAGTSHTAASDEADDREHHARRLRRRAAARVRRGRATSRGGAAGFGGGFGGCRLRRSAAGARLAPSSPPAAAATASRRSRARAPGAPRRCRDRSCSPVAPPISSRKCHRFVPYRSLATCAIRLARSV